MSLACFTPRHFCEYIYISKLSFDIKKLASDLVAINCRVDDVEDNSNLRRGYPVAHSIFGIAQTINSANYIYFCALKELSKLKNKETLAIYTG